MSFAKVNIISFRIIFGHLSFLDISGSCNRAARLLAGFAKVNSEPSIWLEEAMCLSFQLSLKNYFNIIYRFLSKKKKRDWKIIGTLI